MTAIYHYGSQGYGTPQEAFDACQAANEVDGVPQEFTETNYIRGCGAAAHPGSAAGEPVLRLVNSSTGRGVLPTPTRRLVIDRNGLDRVEFADDQDAGCIVGGNAAGQNLASNVTVDGVMLHSSATATGKGIIVCPDQAGGETAFDWRIKNLDIYAAQYSLIVGCLCGLTLENVRLLGANNGSGIYNGTYGNFTGALVMLNCMGRAVSSVMNITSDALVLTLLHCSFYSLEGSVLTLYAMSDQSICNLVMLNTILQTKADSQFCILADPPRFNPMYLNGNCYHFPGAGAGLMSDTGSVIYTDLSVWQGDYGADLQSINADPLMTDAQGGDFTLQAASPCRNRGRTATAAGYEGNERALSVDIGAYQPSLAANWSLKAEGGELTAQIQGRVPIWGL